MTLLHLLILLAVVSSARCWSSHEYLWLGDNVTLTMADGRTISGGKFQFTLDNGLNFTYGDLVAFSGDFYAVLGTSISDQQGLEAQIAVFLQGFRSLLTVPHDEPLDIDTFTRQSLNFVLSQINRGSLGSRAYKSFCDQNGCDGKYTSMTLGRYLTLALTNWDHFFGVGGYSFVAWSAGHTAACRAAAAGNLTLAYALNAFADHYLTDSYSAGHVRTPRKLLAASGESVTVGSLLSLVMHNEDCSFGINVYNKEGGSWYMQGDGYLWDPGNADNLRIMRSVLQQSVDDVYQCFVTRQASNSQNDRINKLFPRAWQGYPLNNSAPLFFVSKDFTLWRREDVNDPGSSHFVPICPGLSSCVHPLADCWCQGTTETALKTFYDPPPNYHPPPFPQRGPSML